MRARSRPFLVLWALAVAAATAAFSLHVAMRIEAIELGYELGRAHAHVSRLREVKRVLELELASYTTPERVDLIARTLFGMTAPTPERMLSAGALPSLEPDGPGDAPRAAERIIGGPP